MMDAFSIRSHPRRAALVAAATLIAVLFAGALVLLVFGERVTRLARLATIVEAELHEVDAAVSRAVSGSEAHLPEIRSDLEELVEAAREIETSSLTDVELAEHRSRVVDGITVVLDGIERGQPMGEDWWNGPIVGHLDEMDEAIDQIIIEFAERSDLYRRSSQAGQIVALLLGSGVAALAFGWVRALRVSEQSVRDKDAFIATVSHELRTPLTAVVGMAQILHHDAELPAEMRRELAGTIHQQGVEVSNLVEDLLVAARTEIGEITVVPARFDVLAVIAEVVAGIPDGEVLDVPHQPSSETIEAIADPLRVRQVLRNLVTNAMRYGGARIRFEVVVSDAVVRVAVVDDGNPIELQDPRRCSSATDTDRQRLPRARSGSVSRYRGSSRSVWVDHSNTYVGPGRMPSS